MKKCDTREYFIYIHYMGLDRFTQTKVHRTEIIGKHSESHMVRRRNVGRPHKVWNKVSLSF